MGITVNKFEISPKSLAVGVNNVKVEYYGRVSKNEDNDVSLSAISTDPNVKVVSVTPSTATYPLTRGLLSLNIQLSVIQSGDGGLQVTLTITFKTATDTTIDRKIVLLY